MAKVTNKKSEFPNGLCFVIAPIGRAGSQEHLHSNQVFDKLIYPAAKECGYEAMRADHFLKPTMITTEIIKNIYDAPLVIANLTGVNANVYYELALRHALDKPVLTIAPLSQANELPFDIAGNHTIFFDIENTGNIKKCRIEIIKQIQAIHEAGEDSYYNPITASLELITVAENAPFSLKDLKKALDKIHDLIPTDVTAQLISVYVRLRQNGIATKFELRQITTNEQLLDALRNVYIEELVRPKQNPLDPMAIAEWAPFLYFHSYENNLDIAVDNLRKILRKFPEYLEKHGDLVILEAKYGAFGEWTDVTHIVQGAVRNGSLRLLVANVILGDAAPGKHKQLKIRYKYKEMPEEEKSFEEDDTAVLP